MSNAPGARNFAGDVAWGWLLQVQEKAGADWKYGPFPTRTKVEKGPVRQRSVSSDLGFPQAEHHVLRCL